MWALEIKELILLILRIPQSKIPASFDMIVSAQLILPLLQSRLNFCRKLPLIAQCKLFFKSQA